MDLGNNGLSIAVNPPDLTKQAGRICPLSISAHIVALEYIITGDLLGGDALQAAFYIRQLQQSLTFLNFVAGSIFSCTGVPSSSGSGAFKAPSALNDIYAVGSIAGDAAMFTYQPASDTTTGIPINLSDSGSDRLLGIAQFSGGTFGVAGEVNADATALTVDLSGSSPQVTGGFSVDVGAPDDVFFDLALSRDGTTGYAVGRGSTLVLVCKIDYPGGTVDAGFGCRTASLGSQFAEGHQVVVLDNGDIAIVGTAYYGSVPRMFIAVLDGRTAMPDTAFGADGLWVEGISGSTQSEGWGLVALNFGLAAVGWADVSGQRELVMPVFDGLQPDTRYPNNGIVHEAIGTAGHAVSIALVAPVSATASQDFDFAVAGDDNDGAEMFVIQYQGTWPDSLFGNGFD